MSMQLQYGGYFFPTDAVEVTSRAGNVVRSASGRPLRRTIYLDAVGTLFGAGPAVLTLQENLLREALARPYRDMVLRYGVGQPSGLAMINNRSLSGVVVTSGPDFYEAQGAEYVTVRRFRFTAEAVYMIPGAETALVAWTQTVSVTGDGGPVKSWVVPLNADPVRQVITPRSIIRYVQAGAAVGHLVRPLPPPPVFGRAYLLNAEAAVVRGVGDPVGANWVNPSVQWNYIFESDRPLAGVTPLPVF